MTRVYRSQVRASSAEYQRLARELRVPVTRMSEIVNGRRSITADTALLSRYLRLAVDEEIVITRHGRPAGELIGFKSEEDWFEYRLEHHPEFLRRITDARAALRRGEGIRLEDVPA